MSASFLITFREGLEAAVIVGILFSALRVFNDKKQNLLLWAGVLAGVVASIAFAWVFETFLGGFSGSAEKIYEGTLMLMAFGVITHMILWMNKTSKNLKKELTDKVQKAFEKKEIWFLVALAFTSVVREGIETVIFLKAISVQSSQGVSAWGASLGIIAAIGLGLAIYFGMKTFPVKKFFHVTGVLLIFIAAGLLAHGIVEFQGAEVLPTFIKPLFDLSPLLSEEKGLGSVLKAIFGYDANPSLLAVLAYGMYLTWVLRRMKN